MAGYVYKGKDLDATKPVPKRRPLAECGTKAAMDRHRRNKEQCKVCDEIASIRAEQATPKKARPVKDKSDRSKYGANGRRLMPCGTEAAAKRHKREFQPLDWPCEKARRIAEAKRSQRQRDRRKAIQDAKDKIDREEYYRTGKAPAGYVEPKPISKKGKLK